MKPKGNFRGMMRRFSKGKQKTYIDGDWRVSVGGYDCWFEVYLRESWFIQCVNGELDGRPDLLENPKDFEKYLRIIMEEYPNTYVSD